jgi:flagellin-like hook-associated protein FlgL
MALNDITLAGGMRSNLLSLQLTSALSQQASLRLSTGRRVNSAIDDPAAFFAAQDHRSRASDLASLKDAMGEAIQTIKAADGAVSGITNLIEQAKGLVASARSASTADRATLATQFDALRTQIDQLAADGGYKGKNLLGSDVLTVNFNPEATSTLDITGFDASTTGLAIAASANAWAGNADLDAAAASLDTGLKTLRTNAATLASSSGVVQARIDFTSSMVATLSAGADNLTAADVNEEGANLQALQTRQQLGIVALSLAAQSQQAILRLF